MSSDSSMIEALLLDCWICHANQCEFVAALTARHRTGTSKSITYAPDLFPFFFRCL